MSEVNSVIQAISAILGVNPEQQAKQKSRACLYQDELLDLWGNPSSINDINTLVIVDNGANEVLGSNPMGRHLSALDWANLYVASNNSSAVIYVVDLLAPSASGVFETDHSHFPDRVRYYAPYRSGKISDLDDFVTDIKNASSAPTNAPNQDHCEIARKRWLSSLALADSRAGHHQMNNSLGPLLLAHNNKELQQSILSGATGEARKIMLKALSWAMPSNNKLEPIALDVPQGAGELRILLLDDQAGEGWQQCMAELFAMDKVSNDRRSNGVFTEYANKGNNGSPQLSLWVSTDADKVLTKVIAARGNNNNAWQTGLRLSSTKEAEHLGSGKFSEILFLDLRLFSETGETKENEFFKKVHEAAHGNHEGNFTEPAQQSRDYLEILSSFGKLISDTDFTYPILIWSSTGQRAVIESFKEYTNIHTGIEKPRIDAYFGSAESILSKFKADIQNALVWAEHIVKANVYFQEVMKTNGNDVFMPPSVEEYQHAEIYIDESSTSENPDFRVGVLVAFYKDEDAARRLHSEITDKKLAFCGKNRLPKKIQPEAGKQCTPREDVAQELATLLKQGPIKLMFLTAKIDTACNNQNYLVDNRYPHLLAETLKLLFCVFLRGGTTNVYVATRQGVANSAADAASIFKSFGVLSSQVGNQIQYTSLTNHSVFHPVIAAHAYGIGKKPHTTLNVARGVTLQYKDNLPGEAHYEWQLFHDLILDELIHIASPSIKNAGGLLSKIRSPSYGGATDASWRHLHYYADEFLSDRAMQVYQQKHTIAREACFPVTFNSLYSNKDKGRLLCEAARARVWEDYRTALAQLYRAEQNLGNGSKLAKIIAKQISGDLHGKKEWAMDAYGGVLDVT